MLDCILNCRSALLWVLILLVGFIHLFALIFVQFASNHLEDPENASDRDALIETFGSVQVAMISLLQATSGGTDWEVQDKLMEKVGPMARISFIFFVLFFVVAIWNIITSIFMEHALRLAMPDINEVLLRKQQKDLED